MQGVARAGAQLVSGSLQSAMEHGGRLAVFGVEIGIARGERQPIRLTNNGTDHNLRIEIQISHHLRNNADLLRVLTPEVSEMRLNDFQQLENHGGYTAEVARTRAALETVTQSFDLYVGVKVLGINFRRVGKKQKIDAGGLEFLRIGF